MRGRRHERMTSIHQLLTGFTFGDAISNDARAIRAALRDWGYQSEIFAVHIGTQARQEAQPHAMLDGALKPGTGLILHHSIGSAATRLALEARVTRMMIYHNITPAEFFQPFDPKKARLLRQGREELGRLRDRFDMVVADSKFNASELEVLGYKSVRVVPIRIRFEDLAESASPATLAGLTGDERRILFVGRISPNKKQEDIISAFAYYQRITPRSRLLLVGESLPTERYYHAVVQWVRETGAQNVVLTGKVSQAQLNAYYRRADLFVSMSEHEGFGIPIVEAMHFGIPVLAYKATAVPETMGDAGVLFTEKRYAEIAEMMDLLIEDRALRERVVAGQRRRVLDFRPESVLPQLRNVVEEFAAL